MKKIARCEDFRGVGKVLLNCKWIALLYTNIPVTKEDESCNKITLVVWPSAEGPRDRKVTNRPLASWISKWNFFRAHDEGIRGIWDLSYITSKYFYQEVSSIFLRNRKYHRRKFRHRANESFPRFLRFLDDSQEFLRTFRLFEDHPRISRDFWGSQWISYLGL